MSEIATFRRFLEDHPASFIVTMAEIRGSTPREEGAVMAVSANRTCGTIGGGQLEYIAIDHARRLLKGHDAPLRLDIALGPEIGQCCGGRVEVSLARMRKMFFERALAQEWIQQNANTTTSSTQLKHILACPETT